jgi:hypothetical protein
MRRNNKHENVQIRVQLTKFNVANNRFFPSLTIVVIIYIVKPHFMVCCMRHQLYGLV